MKFSKFEYTDKGWNVNAHSKFLDFIFLLEGKIFRKRLIKKGVIRKTDKVIMNTNYNLKFRVERELEDNK